MRIRNNEHYRGRSSRARCRWPSPLPRKPRTSCPLTARVVAIDYPWQWAAMKAFRVNRPLPGFEATCRDNWDRRARAQATDHGRGHQLSEASVADVLATIGPPTYSAVRTMIRLLKKGLLRHARLARSMSTGPHSRGRQAFGLQHLLRTFRRLNAAVAAILHPSVTKLTDDDVVRWNSG